jgi:hypothetical protein
VVVVCLEKKSRCDERGFPLGYQNRGHEISMGAAIVQWCQPTPLFTGRRATMQILKPANEYSPAKANALT